jgi:hypothetical protein
MRKLLLILSLVLGALALAAADISGTWSASVELDAGSGVATFVLKQEGDHLSGSYSGALGEAKVTGSVKGDDVEWTFETEDAGKVVYKASSKARRRSREQRNMGNWGKVPLLPKRVSKARFILPGGPLTVLLGSRGALG